MFKILTCGGPFDGFYVKETGWVEGDSDTPDKLYDTWEEAEFDIKVNFRGKLARDDFGKGAKLAIVEAETE